MYDRKDLILQTAILYYEKEKTQTQIAEELGISRPTVAKFLKEAKESGIVRISIQHKMPSFTKLSETIEESYGLNKVFIVPSKNNSNHVKEAIGQLCSDLVQKNMQLYRNIGIGWGTTVYEYVQAASYIDTPIHSVVPLIGGIGINDIKYHSNHLAFQLAEKYHCEPTYFYAPAIAENPTVYQAFSSSELVRSVMQKGKDVDVAIVSIGNPTSDSTIRQLGYISNEEAKQIQQSGAVGDILASFYDSKGKPVQISLAEKMIGLKIKDLQAIPQTILLASGKEKIASLKAILQQPKLVTDLIIDSELAEGIME
ncbi:MULTISPECIES: sugar-binding transcriptional regulator [Aerococcus]|uniref:Sugar-binding transcriptional regulator n=1 Tax=Aerococcus mictus TaxID=2976810 RepID=A0A1E9PN73_9LACT|nr:MULTISPECIES: sugar-binding transcriptional regulator [Aerococcus]AEA01617.1 putative sugar-binding domain protein [Aerococcus sp. Group 1]KAA9290504.1 sugar-binding transcriptional regulator [Aerococcus mictus]MBU5611145.1 sugar-binding transcriptional regulator [Aerococcus urinae]MCY3030787.1 sugar-binding transcriptional regulator [Aerococcus sp. Group 1]MCY3039707.1 sugar-binding transcriptional regulator [Aerococcus sp. Group 2]